MDSTLPQRKNPAKKTNTYSTYGDLFYDLLDSGHDPRKINYKDLASDWIKLHILKKYELDCNEIIWIQNTILYFYQQTKKIWKQHKGKVTGMKVQNKHSKFLDKFIDATKLCSCTCIKCFPLETRTVESSNDEILYCKHCDDEFYTEKDLVAHENEFHKVPSQERTILENAERYVN